MRYLVGSWLLSIRNPAVVLKVWRIFFGRLVRQGAQEYDSLEGKGNTLRIGVQ